MRLCGATVAAALVVLPTQLLAQDADRGRQRLGLAQPSAVIAADIALSREARSRGAAESLRRSAADAALVLVPRPQPAAQWLKGRARPSPARDWTPRTVWVSCDGSFAVTKGAWRRGSEAGDYIALWQRQPKDGWRWLLHEDGPARPLGPEPEMIAGRVAECAGLVPRPRGFVAPPVSPLQDSSPDGSLEWRVTQMPSCALVVSANAWNGRAMADVLTWTRPAPPTGCGPAPGERG